MPPLENDPEHEIDDEPPTGRPTWISEALIPRTSPIVPWNNDTRYHVKRLNESLASIRNHNEYTILRMTSLQAEMVNAWQNYVKSPPR